MNEVKKPKRPLIFYYSIVLLVIMLINIFIMPEIAQHQIKEVDYNTFWKMVESGDIGQVEIQDNRILFTSKDEKKIYKTGKVGDDNDLRNSLIEKNINFRGEIIEEIIPETDKEQIETATSLWGCEPIDYGLIENAAGTSYISIDEKYELVNICGKPALYSSKKLTESDIPKGTNLYHLRSGGSLIMREELDIENGGRIADIPDFTGMYVDLGHFIYDDYENTEDLRY